MPKSTFEAALQQAIVQRYREKYGNVQIQFEVIEPREEYAAQVQFVISDSHGFITRYYGQATYQDEQLQMSVRSI